MFEIILSQRAAKDVKSLDPQIKTRIKKKLKEVSESPNPQFKKLTDPKIGTYRIRIGDYRVIFDIEDSKMIILRVGHRREIYQ